MRKVFVEKAPMCDICKAAPACYDAPYHGSSWAYQCKKCVGGRGLSYGTLFVVRKKAPVSGKRVRGKDRIVDFDERYIVCPCGEERAMELDAGGKYVCGCGASVEFDPFI